MSGSSLQRIRKQIDRIDDDILRLLKQRVDLATKAGEIKRARRIAVRRPERERAVLNRLRQKAEQLGMDQEAVEAVYKEIIAMCARTQEVKVAFLGPLGTVSEEAARDLFPSATSFLPCLTITDVFRKVESGEASFGVIPVESSIEGSVTTSLDQFLISNLMICGEAELQVRHNLILNPSAKLEDVKVVLSHPHALAQCRKYLEEHLPSAELKEVESTAKAVQSLADNPNAAAIGSELAAKMYGMKIEARNIQDLPSAFTRFCVLGKRDCPRTGRDKTSVMFSTENVPGALYRALKPFASRNVNITKIESRPTKRKPWDYVFFLDFEGHREDAICKEALEEMSKRTSFLKVLGSYPVWGSRRAT